MFHMEEKTSIRVMFFVAEEESLFPADCCVSHVTGEGRAQLEVRLSRDRPVPLVSV